ncbi:MAG: cupin domain-containing protein [Mycobacterium sp.]
MSMAYLAQPEQQQQLEWLDGGTLAILLDGKATDGQLMIGRFDVSEGEAPPYHKHTREDEVFMLIKGTALVWVDDQEMELAEGGIVFLPKNIPHAYRITSKTADLLMINTPAELKECSATPVATRRRRVRKALKFPPRVWSRERTSSDRSFLAPRADRVLIRRASPPSRPPSPPRADEGEPGEVGLRVWPPVAHPDARAG